ncbi:MAG: site-specific DNA-methyltransferase, partial [Sulfolobales archaeon]
VEKSEELFYNKLKDIFIGAKIEGNSGFINLMRIKSSYFDVVFKELSKEINEKIKEFPEFREEMFDKLYTFFNTYFSESGSIYFTYTPLKSKIYDKIYTNQDDVILFWKTRMLYYVKTDKLWNNLSIEYEKNGLKYKVYFDCSKLEHKSGNEKKNVVYELGEVKDNTITFYVKYSERGNTTKISEIRKKLRENKIYLDEEDLDKIFKIFEKQNEVDYFINKNAKEFLREQFDLWLKNYLFDDESDFSEKRIKQLKLLKEIAYKIIDFVSQFEDELVKIWNKPKFVLNSNYVITLDRIAKKPNGISVIEKILNHKNIDKQIEEWKELGIVDDKFDKNKVLKNTLIGKELSKEYQFLPIDTKYFKDLELEILSLFDDLDSELDGWLIHSENYQALKTILPKFKEKVKTIYIDPPFNKEQDADYLYIVKYKDSTWATMLENRISLAKDFLNEKGSIFVRCDYNGNWIVRALMDNIFGKENFRNEIVCMRVKKQTFEEPRAFTVDYDNLYFYSKNPQAKVIVNVPKLEKIKEAEELWHSADTQGKYEPRIFFGKKLYPPNPRRGWFSQEKINELISKKELRLVCKNCNYIHYEGELGNNPCPRCGHDEWRVEYKIKREKFALIGNLWNDIPGYSHSWNFPTENSEILLKRIIESTTNEGDLVMDFFLGSGTTTAVAHKLKRKWIGIEMGEHFYTVVLPRMKKVLAYDKSGISREKDVKEKYNENNAGGFFKYYDLEQYEQTLRKCHYIPSEPFFNLDDKSIYQQYIFMKDPKLLDAMELDYANNKIKIDFDKIYPNIDIAETLSLIKGMWIKKIGKDYVILKDDNGNEEKIDYNNIDFKTIKPLIWW